MCFYRWSSRHFSPFYSPHLKSPVPTCGPPRLLGFKGLSLINISSDVVFFTLFWGNFGVKTAKIERELSPTFTNDTICCLLMPYGHVRRSVSLTIHLVSVSFARFRSINSVSDFITTEKMVKISKTELFYYIVLYSHLAYLKVSMIDFDYGGHRITSKFLRGS